MSSIATLEGSVANPFKPVINIKFMGDAVRGITDNERSDFSIVRNYERFVELARNIYKFTNTEEVESFLFENQQLEGLLLDAPQQIHRVFGEAELNLEVISRSDSAAKTLLIVIRSPYSAIESKKREEMLLRRWFYDESRTVGGKLDLLTLLGDSRINVRSVNILNRRAREKSTTQESNYQPAFGLVCQLPPKREYIVPGRIRKIRKGKPVIVDSLLRSQ